jgi:EAL domain-containing protein (putative c-di-GMP-specific phosphodiesterase class I)
VIELGHKLGLSVTVEGVETGPQMAQILALSADQAQGYLLGRPGPAENFFGGFETGVKALIQQYAKRPAAPLSTDAPPAPNARKTRQPVSREYL